MKVVTQSLLLVSAMLFAQCSKDVMKTTTSVQPTSKMDASGVYSYVDKMPEFGFYQAIATYMENNIKYPESARKKKTEGRVVIKFIVDEAGNVTYPKITESPDASLSDVVLTAISKMPKWKPGEQNGRKVKVYYTLPISFMMDVPKPSGLEIIPFYMEENKKDPTMRIFAKGC